MWRQHWPCLICISGETACRRTATRRVCCWMQQQEKAPPPPPRDCVSWKPQTAIKSRPRRTGRQTLSTSDCTRTVRCSGGELRVIPARLIPQGKFHPVPESELVIDHAEIIFDHVFRGADGVGYLVILQALGYELDDAVFAFTGRTASIAFVCKHNCLRYNRVASFTRLIPPLIPKRRNSRLK